MSQPTITAYMKPVCGWSNGVRAIFQKYGLEYDDRDIINNADNYREMVEKSGQPFNRQSKSTARLSPMSAATKLKHTLSQKAMSNRVMPMLVRRQTPHVKITARQSMSRSQAAN